jgi:hypothetical protein
VFENLHRFVCPHCRIPIVGKSLNQLCTNLNDHNNQKHPGEPSQWNPVRLSCSTHYIAPEDEDQFERDMADEGPLPGLAPPGIPAGPRPEYMDPHGTCMNSAVDPKFPRLTRDDLDFLKGRFVKWL